MATKSTGDLVTTAEVNAMLAYAVRVIHSADQSLTNSTETALAFNTEDFDTDVMHDTATNNSRLICKTAGIYIITGQVLWASNATGYRRLRIRLNGSTVIGASEMGAVGTDVTYQSVPALWDFSVNDYVELMATQTSGGALAVTASGQFPNFWMAKVA